MKKYLGFVAVWVFLLSCTNTDRDNPNDERASNYIGKSSAEGLSSSVEAGVYPSSSSEENLPSSSSVGPSSSSAEPSSSSEAESSSSVALSSSSVERSSSSAEPSSSSEAESSSSVAPSSSSAVPSSSSTAPPSSSSVISVGLCADFVEGTKREHYEKEKEQFCDERDGKKYVYVVIGTQTWMAENLNYIATNSKCYENLDSNCGKYGKLYNWNTALTVCPTGWHLPSHAEWNVLGNDAKKLKATNGWNDMSNGSSVNGTDDYGFSALPGGGGFSDGSFFNVGDYGYWWSANEDVSGSAYGWYMYYSGDYAIWYNYDRKSVLLSVRCLQD